MNVPLCKIADIIYVRFELVELEAQKKYLNHFGMMLAHEDENSIYFRGTGTSPYIYVATKGKENKYIGSAYKANSFSDLEALSKEFDVDIVENNEPGGGHKVTVIDPDGIEVEVCHGMKEAEPIAVVSKVLNTGQSKQRENELQRFGKAADEWQVHGDKWVYELSSKVKRLGHTAINCKDAQASVDWYSNVLGFLISNNCIGPDGSSMGVDGLAIGAGYGEAENGSEASTTGGDNAHTTAFANYSVGPVTFGAQMSYEHNNTTGTRDEETTAWGLAFNVNENLSISYGERDVVFRGQGSGDITEKGDGIAVAYTMGSMKIAGNMNDATNQGGTTAANDSMTEIAVSFAF